jgi:hypothetical protein
MSPKLMTALHWILNAFLIVASAVCFYFAIFGQGGQLNTVDRVGFAFTAVAFAVGAFFYVHYTLKNG